MASLAPRALDLHFLVTGTGLDWFALSIDESVVWLTDTLLVAATTATPTAKFFVRTAYYRRLFVTANLDWLAFVGHPNKVRLAHTNLLALFHSRHLFRASSGRHFVAIALLLLLTASTD